MEFNKDYSGCKSYYRPVTGRLATILIERWFGVCTKIDTLDCRRNDPFEIYLQVKNHMNRLIKLMNIYCTYFKSGLLNLERDTWYSILVINKFVKEPEWSKENWKTFNKDQVRRQWKCIWMLQMSWFLISLYDLKIFLDC